MADNSLTRLSLTGQLGVSVFLAALICGLFYYFWYSDALEQEKHEEGAGWRRSRRRSGPSRSRRPSSRSSSAKCSSWRRSSRP